MSLRRKYILLLVGCSLLITVAGGWSAWTLASRAIERELDEKLVWVAGAAAEVGLDAEFMLALRPGDEDRPFIYDPWRERLLALLPYVDAAHVVRRDLQSLSLLVSTDPPEAAPIGSPVRWLDAYPAELDVAWSEGDAVTPLFEGEDARSYKYGFKRLDIDVPADSSAGAFVRRPSDAMLVVLMQADYLSSLAEFRRTLVLGSAGAALLFGVLAASLATGIVRPLERLSRAALRIQRGRWDESVADERRDELGRLSRAMERMRVGIVQRDEQLRLMLAQVAHEIRNPLGGLELFASAAFEKSEDPEERQRLFHRVQAEVEALNGIIDEFLTFARPLHPEPRLHDVREPLRAAVELFEPQLRERGGALTVRLPDRPLLARADLDHVKRSVLNLLQNAAQAGTNVWLDAWLRRGEAIVSVRDDGPGVAPHFVERIFEPFVSDKEQGAGLGLAIVKRVLETNGARVVLMPPKEEREPDDPVVPVGRGAEFRIYFQGSEDLPARDSEDSEI